MTRELSADARKIIEARLQANHLAQYCITHNRPRQLFVEAVKACVGIKEAGDNAGPEVTQFLATVGVDPGNAWCMAFMQTCLAYVESTLDVKSPIAAGGGCVDVWHRTPSENRVRSLPLAGAIAVWEHKNKPGRGHTGMVLDCDGVSFHTIEGNTNEGSGDLNGPIVSDGGGVHFEHRRWDLYNPHNGDMLLLGCLKPF